MELHAIAAKKAEGGGSFAVAMTGQEKQRFLDGISEDSGAYYNMLGTVNVEASDCSRPGDRESIHAGIRDSVGFGELGRMVFGVMEEWMVEELEVQVVAKQDEGDEKGAMRWSDRLACVLRQQGRQDEAVVFGERALEIARRVIGKNDGRLGTYLGNLANTYKALGKRLHWRKAGLICFDVCWLRMIQR